MRHALIRERETMLNPALGAYALWAFVCGFERTRGSAGNRLSLWHMVTVLPLVYHTVSRRAISIRRESSGLRAILNREPSHGIAQNEAIFNLEKRVIQLQERTFRSLNYALASGLLRVSDGTFESTTAFRLRRDTPPETRDILKAAEKLGAWAGKMSVFEYLTVLGVDPQP